MSPPGDFWCVPPEMLEQDRFGWNRHAAPEAARPKREACSIYEFRVRFTFAWKLALPCETIGLSQRYLLIEPHADEVLPLEVARREVPALDLLVEHDDAVPPVHCQAVVLCQQMLLELVHEGLPFGHIERLVLLVPQVVELGIV